MPAEATAQRSKCSCYYVSEHQGHDAKAYITDHVEEVRTVGWMVEYRCPLYGKRWLGDAPGAKVLGGEPTRLRTVDRVCRDFRIELEAIGALMADRPEWDERVAALLELLGPCDEL